MIEKIMEAIVHFHRENEEPIVILMNGESKEELFSLLIDRHLMVEIVEYNKIRVLGIEVLITGEVEFPMMITKNGKTMILR